MNARCFLLPAVFFALLAVSWSEAEARPQTVKTTAERLVGAWRLVTVDGVKMPEHSDLTVEFTEDGRLFIRIDSVVRRSYATSGTYRLTGATIWLTSPVEEEGNPVQTRDVTIKAVTRDNLITAVPTAGSEGGREGMVFRRVSTK